jgi:hypothetical protein
MASEWRKDARAAMYMTGWLCMWMWMPIGCEQVKPDPDPTVNQAVVDRVLNPVDPQPDPVQPEPAGMVFSLNESVVTQRPRPDKRLIVFTEEDCIPCQVQKPLLTTAAEDMGLSVGTGMDVEFLDCTDNSAEQGRRKVEQIPCFILIDAQGNEISRAVGGPRWKPLLEQMRPRDITRAAGMSLGTLKGSREKVLGLIEALRPVLGDGGKVSMTYAGQKSPTVQVSGVDVSFAASTTFTWTMAEDTLRCEFNPAPVARVKGFPIKFRGMKVTAERIVVDIPWLPDAEIEVK